ncbi:MAG TPA: site-2 protease family protein [Verrucomicrobiae bacterium]|nr:site-2 protease family protein [Verrucomicrobiae bacterium]
MDESTPPAPPVIRPLSAPPRIPAEPPARPSWWKRLLAPFGFILVLLGKLKGILAVLFKLPVLGTILKTGGTMLFTIWVYAQGRGWPFAFGFVLLIFVHECGHLTVARRLGLKVGAPVFIPFMGAFIALKEAPRNAWIEAQVGIGGPLLGTAGALFCYGLYLFTDDTLYQALAFTGFFLNLFNLAPVGFLDGGRIATALSPWLWVVGVGIIAAMIVAHWPHPNFLLVLILIMSLPRLFSLFRAKTEAERRYFEVTPSQRWSMAAMYFGLIIALVLGMRLTHIDPPAG